MVTINSTFEILLLGKNKSKNTSIEHLLAQSKSLTFKLVKIQGFDNISNIKQTNYPALVLYIYDQEESIELKTLYTSGAINPPQLPLILISNHKEQKITLESYGIEITDHLVWSQISLASLEKTILSGAKQYQNQCKISFLQQQNSKLSSQLKTTNDLFQTIIDNTSTLVWMCDHHGQSTYFNIAWSKLIGRDIQTEFDQSWMVNIHPQDLAKCRNRFNQALAENTGFTLDYRLQNNDGECRWISNYAVPKFTINGRFAGFVGYCFDITSHKKVEHELLRRASIDRLLAQITQKIHTSLDLNQILQTTVVEVNQFLKAEKIQINKVEADNQLTLLFESKLSEYTLSCDVNESKQLPLELFRHHFDSLSKGQIVTQDGIPLNQLQVNSCSTLMMPIHSSEKLWGLLCMEHCLVPRQWTEEEIKLLRRVAMELSVAIQQANLYKQLELANQELEQLSVIDGLTKIANRRKFDNYLTTEWTRSIRTQNPLSVILADIDHFKLYNDTYGHQAGDRCLEAVAQAISRVVKRPADLVARYGGEEFVLVLPNTPIAGAKYLAQQIRLRIKALKIPHINSAVDLYVTLSLGISSCIPRPDLSSDLLIAAADQGLYKAKETGRNRAVEYEIEQP